MKVGRDSEAVGQQSTTFMFIRFEALGVKVDYCVGPKNSISYTTSTVVYSPVLKKQILY